MSVSLGTYYHPLDKCFNQSDVRPFKGPNLNKIGYGSRLGLFGNAHNYGHMKEVKEAYYTAGRVWALGFLYGWTPGSINLGLFNSSLD